MEEVSGEPQTVSSGVTMIARRRVVSHADSNPGGAHHAYTQNLLAYSVDKKETSKAVAHLIALPRGRHAPYLKK